MTDEKMTFEQILSHLQAIVRDLETGELPLEQALERFETGVKLSREGARRLEEVELKVEEILAESPLSSTKLEE